MASSARRRENGGGLGGSRPHQTKERAIVLPLVRPDDCPTDGVYGSLRLCAQHGLAG